MSSTEQQTHAATPGPGLEKFVTDIKMQRTSTSRASCWLHPQTLAVSSEKQPKPWWPLRMVHRTKLKDPAMTHAQYVAARVAEAIARIQAQANAQAEVARAAEALKQELASKEREPGTEQEAAADQPDEVA